MRDGRPLPHAIANAPQLSMGLQLYWTAFMELHSCRSYGFGMGPIPWTAIRDYATAWDFDEEQTIELFRLIRSMDNELLALNDKKRKHKEQREQSSSRKGGGNARHRNI